MAFKTRFRPWLGYIPGHPGPSDKRFLPLALCAAVPGPCSACSDPSSCELLITCLQWLGDWFSRLAFTSFVAPPLFGSTHGACIKRALRYLLGWTFLFQDSVNSPQLMLRQSGSRVMCTVWVGSVLMLRRRTLSSGGTIPSACHPVGMLHVDGALACNLLCDLGAGCFSRLDFGPGWSSNVHWVSVIEVIC